MAAKQTTIAEELLNAITPEPFTKVLCLLHDSRITTVEKFRENNKALMKDHWLDSSVLLSMDKEEPTPTGIFEIFGRRVGLNTADMKEKLIDWMCDEHVELANCMSIALNQSKQTLAEWLQ